MQMDIEIIKKYYILLLNEFKKESCGFLEFNPIQDYLKKISGYPQVAACKFVSRDINAFCKDVINTYSEKVLENYHKIILLKLILNNYNRISESDLPLEIQNLYNNDFERIAFEIINNNYTGSYLYGNDKFRKDIGLCSMRLIPVGAIKIHLDRLPLSFLYKQNSKNYIQGIKYLIATVKGYKPFYNMHLYQQTPNLMSEFNEEGWKNYYRRIAMLLKINTKVKGVFGSSWFFDPILEKISPNLIYLKNLVTDNGGKLFYLGTSEEAVKDATLKSKTRYNLYVEGKYIPTRYLVIWPRVELIKWSMKN